MVKVKSNPENILGLQVVYKDAKGRFCSKFKAKSFYYKLPRGKKFHKVEIKIPKGKRRSNKSVDEFILDNLDKLKRKKYGQALEKEKKTAAKLKSTLLKKPVLKILQSKKFDTYIEVLSKDPIKGIRREQEIYGQNHYFQKKLELNRSNSRAIISKLLFPSIISKLIPFLKGHKIHKKEKYFRKSFQVKVIGDGKYNRRFKNGEEIKLGFVDTFGFSHARGRGEGLTPSLAKSYVKDMLLDLIQKLTERNTGYLFRSENNLYIAGFRIEVVKVK